MLTQAETGLGAGDYAALNTVIDSGVTQYTLERREFIFASHSGSVGSSSENFDVVLSGTYLVRVQIDGDALQFQRLANEDSGDQSWGAWADIIASGVDSDVPPSMATSGNTIRVFYYDGSNVKYSESANNGSSWGFAQTVGALSDVAYLGAVATTRCHVATYDTSKYNTRLHVYTYSGSWALTSSDIYYPFEFVGFSALSVGEADAIVISSYVAPGIGLRVAGTDVARKPYIVGG